ncbi:MAG: site-specific integrase, partial [Myxococcota bacterium]
MRPTPKSEAGLRTLPLPRFAIDVHKTRRRLPFPGQQKMIFSSTAGTFRDPNNKWWRQVRVELGAGTVTTHSFRKSLATL